jgi:hypothetical protein
MSEQGTTWLACRVAGLEPVTELPDESLKCLAIEAGLLGLDLHSWMLAVLRAGVEREKGKPGTVEEHMGRYLELKLPEAVVEGLKRQYWDYLGFGYWGEGISDWLCFASWPGHVLLTERLVKQGRKDPGEVARRLLAMSLRQMGKPTEEDDRIMERDRQRFLQREEQGHFSEPLRRATKGLALA